MPPLADVIHIVIGIVEFVRSPDSAPWLVFIVGLMLIPIVVTARSARTEVLPAFQDGLTPRRDKPAAAHAKNQVRRD